MTEGCFHSASSCVKYPYIEDLYLQIFLIIASNAEAVILVKIFLDATFFWHSIDRVVFA